MADQRFVYLRGLQRLAEIETLPQEEQKIHLPNVRKRLEALNLEVEERDGQLVVLDEGVPVPILKMYRSALETALEKVS